MSLAMFTKTIRGYSPTLADSRKISATLRLYVPSRETSGGVKRRHPGLSHRTPADSGREPTNQTITISLDEFEMNSDPDAIAATPAH